MSLILDALRKSDRQRSRQASDRLHDGPGPAATASLPRWLPGGLLVAVLLLAGALLLVTLRPLVDRGATGGASQIMENEPARPVIRALGGEVEVRPVQPAPVNEKSEPATVRAPESKAAPAALEHLDAPPFSALPEEIRARLPQLHVDMHAWAEDPAVRFVLINLHRYREGEQMSEGPVVRQILPDGVLLELDDTLFFLPRQ